MSTIQKYSKGDVIFRQGDQGDCMYDIQFGEVGIFYDYGGPNEKKLATLMWDQFFGEMGLLTGSPRSATAVSLDSETVVEVIREEDFYAFFEKNPPKVLLMMQQMSNRLRRTTREYVEACRTVRDAVEADQSGSEKSGFLKDKLRKLSEFYKGLVSV